MPAETHLLEEVLCVHVPMRTHLLEEPSSLVLEQTALLDDVIKELPRLDVLHDHEYVPWSLDDLVQPDDVGVHE